MKYKISEKMRFNLTQFQIKSKDSDNCLTAESNGNQASVQKCHGQSGSQYWEYFRGVLKRDTLYLNKELKMFYSMRVPVDHVISVMF